MFVSLIYSAVTSEIHHGIAQDVAENEEKGFHYLTN